MADNDGFHGDGSQRVTPPPRWSSAVAPDRQQAFASPFYGRAPGLGGVPMPERRAEPPAELAPPPAMDRTAAAWQWDDRDERGMGPAGVPVVERRGSDLKSQDPKSPELKGTDLGAGNPVRGVVTLEAPKAPPRDDLVDDPILAEAAPVVVVDDDPKGAAAITKAHDVAPSLAARPADRRSADSLPADRPIQAPVTLAEAAKAEQPAIRVTPAEPVRGPSVRTSIEQAKRAFDAFVATSEQAIRSMDTAAPPRSPSVRAINERIVAFTKATAEANFDLAMKLAAAQSAREVVDIQAAHGEAQMAAFTAQLEELRMLSAQLIREAAQTSDQT